MKLLAKLQQSVDFWFLLVTSFVFFLIRLPSFFEPYWYGDEGVYEVLGFGIRHGRLLYQGIWDNKPPLLYLIYALFDGNQPQVKFFSFVVGLLAVYAFFALSNLLFQNKKAVYVTTIIFALLLGLPFLEGNIANAENFMVLPSVLAMYLVIKTIQQKKYSLLLFAISGILLGMSFLIKVVAVFDFATAFLIIGFAQFAFQTKVIKNLFIQLFVFSVAFFLPLIATVGFFANKGILKTFIQSAFLSNIGYVNYGNQFLLPFTHIVIPQGFLLVKLLFLLILVVMIFVKRNVLSLTQLLVFLWVPFSLFSAFFSQRPFTHYVLVLIAAISLFVGMLIIEKLKVIYAACLVIIVLLLATNFWFYTKTPGYYMNFVRFVSGQESVTVYQSFFDAGVPRDYHVAEFIRQNTAGQSVFLWTNSAQIYYLVQRLPLGRYTVAYHMTLTPATMSETNDVLQKVSPRFVVILPNAPTFPFPMVDYKLRASIDGGLIYEKLF